MHLVLASPAKNENLAQERQLVPPNLLALEERLVAVLASIRPVLDQARDEAFAELILSANGYEEPLSTNEMLVLGVGLYKRAIREREGDSLQEVFGYRDILDLTKRFGGKALATGTAYGAIRQLIDKGLIYEHDPVKTDGAGRPPVCYSVTDLGRDAFRLTVLASKTIKESKCKRAA